MFNNLSRNRLITEQKIKFSIKDFFSKCEQIRRKFRVWSYILEKSLMENFSFSAVNLTIARISLKSDISQQILTCSKSTIKILKKGVK